MASALHAMSKHLESLGYQSKETDDGFWFTHPKRPGFRLTPFRGGLRFVRYLESSRRAKKNPQDFADFVNSLNADATLARYFVDRDHDLVVEFWIPASYDKTAFATLIAAWQADNGRILALPRARDFLF